MSTFLKPSYESCQPDSLVNRVSCLPGVAGSGELTMPSNCFLLGDAEASTTRLCRSSLSTGSSNGSNGGGPGGLRGDSMPSLGGCAAALVGVGTLLRDSS